MKQFPILYTYLSELFAIMVRLIPRLGVKTAPRILRFLRTNKTAANIRIKACHLSTVFEHKINVSNDIGAITPNVSAPRKKSLPYPQRNKRPQKRVGEKP